MVRLEEAFYTWSCKEQSNEKFQKLSSIRDPLIFELKREKKALLSVTLLGTVLAACQRLFFRGGERVAALQGVYKHTG